MKHNVFGEIEYEYLWKRDYTIKIFGEEVLGLLQISGDEEEEVDKIQVEAFEAFETNRYDLGNLIEQALFSYYCSVVDEYRDRYGEEADKNAPVINSAEDMKSLVTFEAVNLPFSFVDGERVVGVLFKSKWEIEHGVAVKIVNEEIVEVGYQDIVL